MSNVCCEEFGGWVKSFTKIERALAILEAILLVVFIVLLVLFISHLIVCSEPDEAAGIQPTTTGTDEKHGTPKSDFQHVTNSSEAKSITNTSPAESNSPSSVGTTFSLANNKTEVLTEPAIKCSWTPSVKTTATAHYYEDAANDTNNHSKQPISPKLNGTYGLVNTTVPSEDVTGDIAVLEADPTPDEIEEFIQSEYFDDEEAEDKHKSHVAGLVKLKPPNDVIFGCILTIVTEYWTLTAASCIEAIEEIDSLDSFIIMKHYGSNKREPLHSVEDVQIHPLYEGKNRSYDLAALKSADSLSQGGVPPMELATLLDYALLSLAERLTLLGFGGFRSIDKSPSGRSLRQAHVYSVPSRACAGWAGAGAALRHLEPREGGGAPCGPRGLCAAVLRGRAAPCNYCSGAPLLLAGRLLAIMADNHQCGVTCHPQLYVNLPALAHWIRHTTGNQ